MPELMAVYPPRGTRVHLHLDGYKLSPRRPDVHQLAMCGASVNEQIPPPVGPLPTGRVHAPFRDVRVYMDLPRPPAVTAVPWPGVLAPTLRWCSLCIGRAVEHYGIEDLVTALIAQRIGDPNA